MYVQLDFNSTGLESGIVLFDQYKYSYYFGPYPYFALLLGG